MGQRCVYFVTVIDSVDIKLSFYFMTDSTGKSEKEFAKNEVLNIRIWILGDFQVDPEFVLEVFHH